MLIHVTNATPNPAHIPSQYQSLEVSHRFRILICGIWKLTFIWRAVNVLYLIDDIRFTRQKLDTLYRLGVMYTWFGPEASFIIRGFFRIFHETHIGRKRDRWISDRLHQFDREFRSLQRVSYIPPRYWDNAILNLFEEYVLNEKASTLEECIHLYDCEKAGNENRSASSYM